MKIRISIVGKSRKNNQRGFTYVTVMMAVMLIGIMAGVAATLTSRIMQAEREKELLFRGLAYQNAIKSYYEAGRQFNTLTFPRSLADLLQDPRFPGKRHIRVLYRDPAGEGMRDWNLVRAFDGGISGVVSKNKQTPLKTAHFPRGLESFAGKKSYAEWIFQYSPAVPVQVVPAAGRPGMPGLNKR